MSRKNKDIRSFFSVVPKNACTQPVTNTKKRPIVISSDEEDTPKKKKNTASTIDKRSKEDEKPPKKQIAPSKHARIVLSSSDEEDEVKPKKTQNRKTQKILSDSEDEIKNNNKSHKTKKPTPKKEKLVPKNAIDFFGKAKVKQTPTEKKNVSHSRKQSDSKSGKSDDKFEATLKQIDKSKSQDDKDFEDTLLDLDDDFDANILDETTNNAVAKENNAKKTTPKTPKNKDQNKSFNDSGMDPDQESWERKRQARQGYQQYLNKPEPINKGNKDLPEGKPDSLKNLCFVKTGVLDSMESEEFEHLLVKHGGRCVKSISGKVNYLVVGVQAGPAKLSKAENKGIKCLSEDELLDMILIRSGMKPKYVKAANRDNGVNENIDETVGNKSDEKQKPQSKEKDKTKRGNIDVTVEWEPKVKKIKHGEIPEVTKLTPKKDSVEKPIEKSLKSNSPKPSTSRLTKTVPISIIHVETVAVNKENISLADKYRPTVSTKIIGQQKNVESLTKWLKNWSKNHIGKDKPILKKPPIFANHDGAYFKAALLSGPPGVGKTTAAHLVSKELGYDVVEYNASDTRSKKMLQQQIERQLQSKSIASFAKDGSAPTSRHVLLMDEVDGMSGNEDRGGIQELIGLIKKTDIPIICMCNDKGLPKMRSLVDHVFNIPFGKPNTQPIKGAMNTICFREGIKISNETLDQIITTAGNDVRQVLNHITMWAAMQNNNESIEENSSTEYKFNSKDVKFGSWAITRKQLDYKECKDMSLGERLKLFHHDYNDCPLFIQENYLNTTPHMYTKASSKKEQVRNVARRIAEASSAISMGDIIDNTIRRRNNWSLLEGRGIFSTVAPGYYVHGDVKVVSFAAWLGKNSRGNKFQRMLSELRNHTRLSLPGGRIALNLDYLKPLRDTIVSSLKKDDIDGALEVMHTNNLLRVDFDNILELAQWKKIHNDFSDVQVKTKAAFTRNYNKSSHMLPYSIATVVKKKKRTAVNDLDYGDVSGSDDDHTDDDADDIANSAMIKKKVKNEPAKVKKKPAESKPKITPSKSKAGNKKK